MEKIQFDYSWTINEDGSKKSFKEVMELLNSIPLNENNTIIEPVQIDCSMEEFINIHGGHLWEDLKKQRINAINKTRNKK